MFPDTRLACQAARSASRRPPAATRPAQQSKYFRKSVGPAGLESVRG